MYSLKVNTVNYRFKSYVNQEPTLVTQISSGAPECLSGLVRTMLGVNLGLPGFMSEMTLGDKQAWASSRSAQQISTAGSGM